MKYLSLFVLFATFVLYAEDADGERAIRKMQELERCKKIELQLLYSGDPTLEEEAAKCREEVERTWGG